MNNVTIVGLGAIGMVYATAFADAGVPLRIAVDPQRKSKYEAEGLYFNGKKYDFEYFTPTQADKPATLVIIATKSSGLESALELIHPIIGPETQILPLLNGITSEEITASIYGWERVIYSYFIGHTATKQKNRIIQDGHYKTYFGEMQNGEKLSSRVAAVKELFDLAGIHYVIPEDMLSSMWYKFVVNIGMNQATGVLQRPYGHLQTNPKAKEYMIKLMEEAVAVARAEGIEGTDGMLEKAVSALDTLSPEDGSSMYQDVMNGRRTEVDIFADTLCAIASKHGIHTPYNTNASLILNAL